MNLAPRASRQDWAAPPARPGEAWPSLRGGWGLGPPSAPAPCPGHQRQVTSVPPTGAQVPRSGLSGPLPCPLSAGCPCGNGWGGAASPQTLTFEDGHVDGGPHVGQRHPWLPSAPGGIGARGGGGPGGVAALHAGPSGQPQAGPGPHRQPQKEQEAGGCHPRQSLVGDQRGAASEKERPR